MAVNLFNERLVKPLYYRFGAYQTCIELLKTLFPDRQDRLPLIKEERAQVWTLNTLALSYGHSSQPRNAVPIFESSIAMDERRGDKENLAIGLSNLASSVQIILGDLAATERNLRRSIELCREINDEFDESVVRHELALLLTYCGKFAEAETELSIAQEIFDRRYKEGHVNSFVSTVRAFRALLAILTGDFSSALKEARESRRWADEVARVYAPYERDFILSEWLMGAALILEGNDLNTAALHLTDALTRCRRINHLELEPNILLTWARLYHARGKAQEAQGYAEEALAIADRCEYRLKQAEIHNFLARLALDAGNREVAREHAEVARERAWCDGPPHCYRVALDEAEGTLRELGHADENL